MSRFAIICLTIVSFSTIAGIELDYSRVSQLYEDENFSMYVIIAEGIASVQEIHLIIENDRDKKEYAMSIDGNSASVYIERNELPSTSFTYYFRITLKDRTSYIYPENPALRVQNTVSIVTMKEQTGYEINAIYPPKTSIIKGDDFHIAVYVRGEHRKKGIILDDIDITHKCTIGENIILFYPDSSIEKGVHKVNVTVNGFIMDEWGFTVIDSNRANFSINGNIEIGSTYRIYEIDSVSGFYADTVRMKNKLFSHIFGYAGPGQYLLNACINYNDFQFNDFSNSYTLQYDLSGMRVIAGDSRIFWNRWLSYGVLCRGARIYLNRGIFLIDLAGGYSYRDAVNSIIPAMQYSYGINTGIKMANFQMQMHVLKRDIMEDYTHYSSLYSGLRIHLQALGMIALKSDVSYRIMQNVKHINADGSIENVYDKSAAVPDALNGNLDISLNAEYAHVSLFTIKQGADETQQGNAYSKSMYSGMSAIIPVMKHNADIGLDYSFLTYDSIMRIEHQYSAHFNYHNSATPLINIRFTHRMPFDSILKGHIVSLSGNISHQLSIMGRKSGFALFIQQNTGNYTDSINAYNKTVSGGNLSISWNRFISNRGGFTVSGYSGYTAAMEEQSLYLNTNMLFDYINVGVNLAYSHVSTAGDTIQTSIMQRLKADISCQFRMKGFSIKAGLGDYIQINTAGPLHWPEINVNAGYAF